MTQVHCTLETLTEMLRVSVEVEDGDAAGHEAVAQGADLLEAGGEADAAEAGVRVEAEAGEPGAVLAAAEADDDGPRVLSLGLAAVLVLPLHLRTLGRGGQGSPQPLGTTFGKYLDKCFNLTLRVHTFASLSRFASSK